MSVKVSCGWRGLDGYRASGVAELPARRAGRATCCWTDDPAAASAYAVNRREFLASGLGAVGAAAAGVTLVRGVWPMLAGEDLVPGEASPLHLASEAWETTSDRVSFAALGDNGSGGRQAIAVAERMAKTYRERPFGLVALLGDICYYGSIEDRFHDVFRRPMAPLIEAGVGFELAIGNHDEELHHSDEGLAEIEAELELLGTPGRYYTSSHGPVDFFYLDSSVPARFGDEADTQLEWLDDALSSSTNQWKVVALHHPPYSSGAHGSTPGLEEELVPILSRHAVDLVLAGHDDVDGDRLTGTCIRPDGSLADEFTLRAREGR
jgi:hypothetical protein